MNQLPLMQVKPGPETPTPGSLKNTETRAREADPSKKNEEFSKAYEDAVESGEARSENRVDSQPATEAPTELSDSSSPDVVVEGAASIAVDVPALPLDTLPDGTTLPLLNVPGNQTPVGIVPPPWAASVTMTDDGTPVFLPPGQAGREPRLNQPWALSGQLTPNQGAAAAPPEGAGMGVMSDPASRLQNPAMALTTLDPEMMGDTSEGQSGFAKLLQASASEGQADSAAELLEQTTTVKNASESALAKGADLQVKEAAAGLKSYATSVEVPVSAKPDWIAGMENKMSWLVTQKIQFAEIHLTPAELGPVEVRIQVQNDQASVTINSQHASVRDMLDLTANRLREMLAEQGLSLEQFDVTDQSQQHAEQESEDDSGQPGLMAGIEEAELMEESGLISSLNPDQLVDYYA